MESGLDESGLDESGLVEAEEAGLEPVRHKGWNAQKPQQAKV